MRGFVCGLIVSVCFVLGTGRAWHTTLPTTQPARAGQPQTAPAASSLEPASPQPQSELQPQVARELLELRRQLGGTWQSGQEGDAAFLDALQQVAEEASKTAPASDSPRNVASPIPRQACDQLSEVCHNLLTLAKQLHQNGQVQAADRLYAFETLLRGEVQNWAATQAGPAPVDTILAPADKPQSVPAP